MSNRVFLPHTQRLITALMAVVLLCLGGATLLAQDGTEAADERAFSVHLQVYGVQPSRAMDNGGPFLNGLPRSGAGAGVSAQLQFGTLPIAWTMSAAWLQPGMSAPQSMLRSYAPVSTSEPWRVLPVTTGVYGSVRSTPSLAVYGTAALGLAWIDPPDVELNAIYETGRAQWESLTVPAWSVGAGVVIRDVLTLGVGYLGCGSHEIHGTVSSDGQPVVATTAEQSISMFHAVIGYRI
jgi:hypothetical protein